MAFFYNAKNVALPQEGVGEMAKNKKAVLNLNKEFRTLYYRGRSKVSPVLVTYVRRNSCGFCRVGITTGKKLGKAVSRNRCRRVIREAYRLLKPQISGGWDIVFVARTRTVGASMQQVKAAMFTHFKDLSLIKPAMSGGKTNEKTVH